MGSFNATCMVSNLPIQSGEKVKVILLYQPTTTSLETIGNGYVGCADIYMPAFLPLTAVHEDSASVIEFEDDWNYRLVQHCLRIRFGDTLYDGDKEIKNWTLEQLIESIDCNRAEYYGVDPVKVKEQEFAVTACETYEKSGWSSERVKQEWYALRDQDVSPSRRKVELKTVLIREDIYNHIHTHYKGEFFNIVGKGYTTVKEYCKSKFDLTIKASKKLDWKKMIKEEYSLFNSIGRGDLRLSRIDAYTIALGNKDLHEDILRQYSELYALHSYLGSIRKGWMIQPGRGMQHLGYEDHKILAEKIIEVCNTKIEEGF